MMARNRIPSANTSFESLYFGRGIPVMLDRRRWLCFDPAAVELVKKEIGKDPLSPAFFEGEFTLAKFVVFVWAALRADDPALTVGQVIGFLTPTRIEDILSAIREARKSRLMLGEN